MSNIIRQPCDDGAVIAGVPASPANGDAGRWILAATILGSSMVFIDGTVVNVALPAVQTGLNASIVQVQWVVEAYALFLASLLLVGGSLGDRLGRRFIFGVGVALFAASSIWCGLAPDITQLIFARVLQGTAGALLVPASLAIISASFPQETRGRAIGTWSGFSAITAALGPVLGGWLIDHFSWRAAFFINVPIAVVIILILYRSVPESRDQSAKGRLDIIGAALGTLGLCGLVFGMLQSSTWGFANRFVIGSLLAGSVLLAMFGIVERKVANPLLPLSLFRSANFSGANLLTFLLYAGLSGVLFFLPLNLIQVQGYSATAAGAALLPFVLIMFLLSRWAGGLVTRLGPRLPLIIGPSIAAVGFALFAVPGKVMSYWLAVFPAVVVLGVGMAVAVAPLTATVMSSVPEPHAGIASGINNAVSRTAGLIAVGVFGIVLLAVFNNYFYARFDPSALQPDDRAKITSQLPKLAGAQLPQELPDETRTELRELLDRSFIRGFRVVSLLAALLALMSAFVSAVLITTDEPGGNPDALKLKTAH